MGAGGGYHRLDGNEDQLQGHHQFPHPQLLHCHRYRPIRARQLGVLTNQNTAHTWFGGDKPIDCFCNSKCPTYFNDYCWIHAKNITTHHSQWTDEILDNRTEGIMAGDYDYPTYQRLTNYYAWTPFFFLFQARSNIIFCNPCPIDQRLTNKNTTALYARVLTNHNTVCNSIIDQSHCRTSLSLGSSLAATKSA